MIIKNHKNEPISLSISNQIEKAFIADGIEVWEEYKKNIPYCSPDAKVEFFTQMLGQRLHGHITRQNDNYLTPSILHNSYIMWGKQLRDLPINMANFEDYLKSKYDFISKMDMAIGEKETRKLHNLTLGQAVKVWNKIYND